MRASHMPLPQGTAWITTALLVALLMATQAIWACAPVRAQETDGSLYRFEGFIKVKNPDRWVISTETGGNLDIAVSPETLIVSKAGYAAEVDARVIVFARRASAIFHAYSIQIDRPAGAAGIALQFTGAVTKRGEGFLRMGDMAVAVTRETPIIGTMLLGSKIVVSATSTADGLQAGWIRVLPEQKVVEFEGTLQKIDPGYWIIDGHRVEITAETRTTGGPPQEGMFVECRALKHDDDRLTALDLAVSFPSPPTRKTGTIIQMRSQPGGAATWSVLLDQTEPGAYPSMASVRVDQNTWVDQTRAVADSGQWLRLRGEPTGSNSYQADLLRVERGAQTVGAAAVGGSAPHGAGASPWSTPVPIASTLSNAENSMLAYTGDGAAHAIWEADDRLYAAHQARGGTWSTPEEVAYGFAPYMIAAGDGALHVAFVNSFMENFEAYYVVCRDGKWSLPINMSHTDGNSQHPKLALAPDGVLHATWMDSTPGYWTTYHATWAEPFWSTLPIPSGRGEAPNIAAAPDGTVYVVWQDKVSRDGATLDDYEVFLAGLHNGTWTPPLNISDSRGVDTLGPDITVTADALAHVVWIEGNEQVRYSYGLATSWSPPTTIETVMGYANGVRIAAESGKLLHVAWDEEGYAGYEVHATVARERAAEWPKSYVVFTSSDLLRDVALASDPAGSVGMSWSKMAGNTGSSIYTSRRLANWVPRLWVPLVSRR